MTVIDPGLEGRLTAFPAPAWAGERAPAVLVLPGGAYLRHGEHEGEPVARWLNELGLAAFVLRYRVAPHRHPAALEDGRTALRAIRAQAPELGIDPDRVAVLGFSAGGHLAATLAGDPALTPAERPALAVLCYPVISFTQLPHLGSLEALLGPDATPAERRAASRELTVDRATPPVFLWHTADDPSVDVSHSLRYTEALAAAGVPVELHVLPHGRHGVGLAPEEPELSRWTDWCAAWFRSHGWRPDAPEESSGRSPEDG
ncbi:alpha/beta hydrolase [Streptomyces millisiae]|uniref:Alpha/beta hydrolase n=1 Tax=Streptomyces millisiae TaxID=3075542 RepID=A0ABU2LGZ2_9ACTN|nr:alpha/beta hydrolase [Streptomyces sp. DSM 44918]MDT0316860.1 alpha/beta hydrolase [Streptomyces sp. DSM 44918]